ncbi:hypothetical protein KFL_000060730 [Klebsormidium nitens]|uniref:RBR-type E3 ubiquitin transferase n=1 Tax=Klebsormidium nitens TaxID=105231 RepID=A0A0U9HIC7_KLENI|nr:hypothetical protein KFL_000060730 [Klebsormidium nitens]|eukprot:GAQ78006.1 hypothetical protein KFL_000060730 [Klebsormidium nitens]
MGQHVPGVEQTNGHLAEQGNPYQRSNSSRRRGGNRGGASKSWRTRNVDSQKSIGDEGLTVSTDKDTAEGSAEVDRQQEEVVKMVEELAASNVGEKEGALGKNQGASTSYEKDSGDSVFEIRGLVEPMLGEEERAANEEEQQDEVMVLESIFATDFQQTSSDPTTFELLVHVALPAAHIQVLGRLLDSGPSSTLDSLSQPEASNTDETSDFAREEEGESATAQAGEVSEAAAEEKETNGKEPPRGQIWVAKSWQGGRLLSLTLEHLPPLRLTCTLPAAYPSHSPPRFALSSVWLTRPQLGRLCRGLDEVWQENQGQVVVYSWADWLTRETFETLDLGESFELGGTLNAEGKGKESAEHDERAQAEGWGVQDVLSRLLRYNEEKTMEEFRKGVHECQVCFAEQPGTEFVHLWPGCRHNFCRGCMTSLVDIHVKEGSLARLTCPDTDCKEPLPPNIIKDLLAPEQFQRWETLMLQKTFDSMSDVVYCPRCETATIEEPDHTAQCQKCFFAFCSLCDDATHFGSQCMDAEAQLAVLRERTRGRLPAEEQKRKEAALLNEILNMKYVEREAKKCPKCGMAIQKDEGCNKMTCWNCSSYFCYKCGKAISGYDHFNSGACVLFEAAEIDAWNRMMAGVNAPRNEARDRIDAQIQMYPNRVRACPACRQPNVKEAGNNHLRCWSCQNHFCGACGKAVLKGSHHFGPKGCKQHTPD